MTRQFVPDEAYVERLIAGADAAFASIKSVWGAGAPVELRDRAGLFHTARHIAYSVRATAPEDNGMVLYRGARRRARGSVRPRGLARRENPRSGR